MVSDLEDLISLGKKLGCNPALVAAAERALKRHKLVELFRVPIIALADDAGMQDDEFERMVLSLSLAIEPYTARLRERAAKAAAEKAEKEAARAQQPSVTCNCTGCQNARAGLS